MTQKPERDLFQALLAIVLLALLIGLSIWILSPFLPALAWATMLVIATWPVMLWIQRRLWGRRWLAVTVMTVIMLLLLVIPSFLGISAIVSHVDDITGWVRSLDATRLQTPPEWVQKLPLVGEKLDAAWRSTLAESGLAERITPFLRDGVTWLIGQLGSLGSIIVHFLLVVVVSAILYSNGESAADGVRRFARRIGGERGDNAVQLAGQAIRGVALGVVVTALAQSLLGGVGIAIAGVPFAPVLTVVMFLLALAQIGAGPVLACCVIWLFWRGESGWGTAMIVWTVLVSALDNVLRPFLIRRGADLPLVLIFVGVVGGLVTFGMIGLFVGPVVLAVTHTLISAWIAAGTPPAADPEP